MARKRLRENGDINFILRVDRILDNDLRILYALDKKSAGTGSVSFNAWVCSIFSDYALSRGKEISVVRKWLKTQKELKEQEEKRYGKASV